MSTASRNLLLKLFPVPATLRMEASGLEISEHSIKYLTFVGESGNARIRRHGNTDLPEGIVVGGEIKDVGGLADALRGLLKDIRNPRVHVSLPEQKGYIFRMNVPRSPDLSIHEAVEFRIEEYVPLPAAEVVFDAEVIASESTQAEYVLNITAFPRATVEAYYEGLVGAGFMPLSFEIESQAAARAVLPQGTVGACMIVDFGETRTAIAVAQAGVVRFTTSLELAGGALTAALKSAGVASGAIEQSKNDEGIASGKTQTLLMPTIAKLRDEIQRHFMYWHTHGEATGAAHLPIGQVFLCGGNANVRGLPEYLSTALRIPVARASVWQNAFPLQSHVPSIASNESLRYATVAGLALRGGIQFT